MAPLIVLLTAMLLVGCPAQPQPRQAKFNLNEYLSYGGTGAAGIYDEAFLTTPGGNVKKAVVEIRGGFKFQVQRVNDDAGAYRLPRAWRSSDIFVGAC